MTIARYPLVTRWRLWGREGVVAPSTCPRGCGGKTGAKLYRGSRDASKAKCGREDGVCGIGQLGEDGKSTSINGRQHSGSSEYERERWAIETGSKAGEGGTRNGWGRLKRTNAFMHRISKTPYPETALFYDFGLCFLLSTYSDPPRDRCG